MGIRVLSFLLITVLMVIPLAEATRPAAAIVASPQMIGTTQTAMATQSVHGEKKKKFKTVTKTFSNAGQIAIPGAGTGAPTGVPANPYPATIQVKGLKKGKVQDVNLILNNFSHPEPDEVDILLAAVQLPGSDAVVMSDVGGGIDAVNLTLKLDDQAAAPLPDSGPLVSGTFQPTNVADPIVDPDLFPAPAPTPNGDALLQVFNGGNPNGTWQLFVVDDLGASTGNLAGGWSLEFKAKVKVKNKKGKRK